MKSEKRNFVDVRELHSRELRHTYSGVLIVSDDGEELGICLRDSGFEFQYNDVWYEAKEGKLKHLCGEEISPPPAERCEWKLSDPDCDMWKSSCGIEWNFIASGPKENGVKFCVNCGKPVSLPVEKEKNV